MSRTTNINDLPISAAVKKLNPGVFGAKSAADMAALVGFVKPTAPHGGNLKEKQGSISYNPRLRQATKGPNQTEAEFEKWLREEWSDTPHELIVQGITLILANGNRYTPDFLLVVPRDTGKPYFQMTAFETKGFMRDDAAVKIKTAARLFPWIKFHLVTKKKKKDGGGWAIEEVLP